MKRSHEPSAEAQGQSQGPPLQPQVHGAAYFSPPQQQSQYWSRLARAIKDNSCQEEARLIAVRMGPPPQHLQHQAPPPHPTVHGAADSSPLQQLSQ